MATRYRRRFRFIRPTFQLKLMASFVGVAVLTLALQYMVFLRVVTVIALDLPNDGPLLLTELAAALGVVFVISLAILLPASVAVGWLVTHRVAGPLYRIETYLQSWIDGKADRACTIRKGDELKSLCELVNRVTWETRQSETAGGESTAGSREAA